MYERDEYLWVVVGDEDGTDPADSSGRVAKGGNIREGFVERLAAARRLSVADLEQKMNQFLGVVGRLFRQAEQQAQMTAIDPSMAHPTGKTSRLQLDEVELSIEITAGGEVKLIAGGKAESKGSIKLKFKRVDG
jgi:hypothetical protein